jgi:ADP-L-glycero-D-manno-heptose 6-epimerase
VNSRTFIVTGGCGFIGSNVTAELLKRFVGAHVVVVDDLRSGSYANVVEACERASVGAFRGQVMPQSVCDIDWHALLESVKPAAVFHLGAITDTTNADEADMLRVNSESFPAMVLAAAEAEVPLVYASSAATYGTPPETARREAFTLAAAGKPNNVYGFSKWMMECHHRRLAKRLELSGREPHVVGLRYFNVFGPGEARKGKMASMAYQLAQQCLRGERPRLFVDGSQARDQVYVGDVVDCTIAAAGLDGRTVRPGVYNLGSGEATTFTSVAAAVRRGLGLAPGDREVEYFEMPANIRAFYQDFTLADMRETASGLGWQGRHAPLTAVESYARMLASAASL